MPEKVLALFEQMSLKSNEVIATLVFNACAKLNNNHGKIVGKTLLEELPATFYRDENLVASAIDMLMIFGQVNAAEHLFQTIPTKNTSIFSIMMKGNLMVRMNRSM